MLILNAVVPDDATPHVSKWFDIEMLALPGGRERTEDEFRSLLAGSGWRLSRVIPTQSMLHVIEAVPD